MSSNEDILKAALKARRVLMQILTIETQNERKHKEWDNDDYVGSVDLFCFKEHILMQLNKIIGIVHPENESIDTKYNLAVHFASYDKDIDLESAFNLLHEG